MPTLPRLLVSALTVVLAGTLAVTVDGTAVASSRSAAQPTPDRPPSAAAGAGQSRIDLGGDTVLPQRARRTAKVQKWKGTTIRYYESLPAKWDWSLSTAVAKWNTAGGRIRFAKVAAPAKAQLRIGYGNIGSAAGMATLGAAKHAYVRLSSRFSNMDAVNARNRVTIMNVLAHELGHVLGFRHTTTRCALMAPVVNVDACGTVPASMAGYYKCHTIDTALVRAFIRLYGGRARYPSATWCLIEALPTPLAGVSFTGGSTSPVVVRWNPPASVPAGTAVVVKRWEASTCGAAPSWADTFRPAIRAGLWEDDVPEESSTACFQLQVLNRLGAGRPAASQLMTRWVPSVVAPVIGVPSYDVDQDEFAFPVTLADGLVLQARWDATDPDTCLTAPQGATNVAYVPVANGQGTLMPDVLPQCVSFFAYDPESNRFSAAVPVTFSPVETGVPDAPVVEEATWDPARTSFLAPASYEDGTHLVYALSEDPDVCPESFTSGQAVTEDEETMGEGVVGFMTPNPDQCVSFYAVDDESGVASEPTQVTVQAPLPTETINAEERLEPRAYPWWYARVTGIATGNHLGYHVFHGPCPTTAPDVVRWRTQLLGDSSPTVDEASGDAIFPSQGAGANCAMFTSLDFWGWLGSKVAPGSRTDRHGPIVMREFVDEGPVPPTIGTPVWNAAQGTFTVPVSDDQNLHAIYDPSDPTTCPVPGASGAQPVTMSGFPPQRVIVTPPATPYSCVTFYTQASEGPVRLSQGVFTDLDVPAPG